MVTKNLLAALPDTEKLKKLCQSLAMLDAIIESEWDDRYSSFNSKWGAAEMLATMRNGGGDEYFTYFNEHGAILKGFDRESEICPYADSGGVWKGVLSEVPEQFTNFVTDEAFPPEDTTFCLWRLDEEGVWKTGGIDYPNDDAADGSDWLLFLLDGKFETYFEWAEDYYGRELDFEAIEKIYRGEPPSEDIVAALNPERRLADLKNDADEIGYPIGAWKQ
jgi:hypothetical protein